MLGKIGWKLRVPGYILSVTVKVKDNAFDRRILYQETHNVDVGSFGIGDIDVFVG